MNHLADRVFDTIVPEYMRSYCEPCWIDESVPIAPWMIAVMAIVTYHVFAFDECAYGNLIVPWCESPLSNEPNPIATWIIAVPASFVSLHYRYVRLSSNGGVLNHTHSYR